MYNFTQEQIFCLFLSIGIIIGFIYDLFRVLRKCFKTPDYITFIEDLTFVTITGLIIIQSIIYISNGEVRFFLFIGIFLGLIIYILTISNLCVIILYVFVKFTKKILEIPIKCCKKIYIIISKNNIKKDF